MGLLRKNYTTITFCGQAADVHVVPKISNNEYN